MEQNIPTRVRLASYDNAWYNPGAGGVKRLTWYFVNMLFLKNPLNPISSLKVFLLKLFGSKIGTGVIIKPSVNVKYPWLLHVGNDVWIGEGVWIDNLAKVTIGDNVCLSQGCMLLTGSHDYKKSSFDLIVKEIQLEDGVWIGAKALVCPGVQCRSHSVLAAQSVATKEMKPYNIYQGNPAESKRTRVIEKGAI